MAYNPQQPRKNNGQFDGPGTSTLPPSMKAEEPAQPATLTGKPQANPDGSITLSLTTGTGKNVNAIISDEDAYDAYDHMRRTSFARHFNGHYETPSFAYKDTGNGTASIHVGGHDYALDADSVKNLETGLRCKGAEWEENNKWLGYCAMRVSGCRDAAERERKWANAVESDTAQVVSYPTPEAFEQGVRERLEEYVGDWDDETVESIADKVAHPDMETGAYTLRLRPDTGEALTCDCEWAPIEELDEPEPEEDPESVAYWDEQDRLYDAIKDASNPALN